MELSTENYFSQEADLEYMSVSQFKSFKNCQAKTMALLNNDTSAEEKEAFLQGKLFETLIAGDIDLFMMQHPEMIASKGATKGELKVAFKKVLTSANKIKQQNFIMDIINNCEKQIIMTGEINGVKVKCCADLLNPKTGDIYDLKCMANFNENWDKENKCYMPWYYYYGYVLQMAIYQEIAKQNYGKIFETHLIAATKEDVPDIQAIHFDNSILKIELEEFSNNIIYYDKVKKGLEIAKPCGHCNYCKSIKKITGFEEVK